MDVRTLVQWPGKVVEELVLAPWTVARVRQSLTELPIRLDSLAESLDATTASLEDRFGGVSTTVEHLDVAVESLAADITAFREALGTLLPELSGVVSGMDGRFEHVESMVGELGDALLNVMGAIPGVRRALREPRGALPGRPSGS